jgi:hypothetical protein
MHCTHELDSDSSRQNSSAKVFRKSLWELWMDKVAVMESSDHMSIRYFGLAVAYWG